MSEQPTFEKQPNKKEAKIMMEGEKKERLIEILKEVKMISDDLQTKQHHFEKYGLSPLSKEISQGGFAGAAARAGIEVDFFWRRRTSKD